jgi:glucosylceramidase
MRIQRMVGKTLSRAAAVLLAVGVLGCSGGGGPDVAGDVCQKADACQALSGISAAQCKGLINTSLSSRSGGARTDLENAYRACVAMMDCDGFRGCVDGLMGGSGTGSGGSTGGGTGGGALAGTGGSAIGGTGGSASGDTAGTGGGGDTGGNGSGGTGGGTAGSSGGTGGSAAGGRGGSATAGRGGTTGSAGTGGTTGGAGTGGASAAPEVVTSAQNAYWMTGQVTKVTSGTADVNVDRNTTFQRWDGFGGTFNEMGWDALSVVPSEIPNAIKYLFDPKDGAKFVYGRVPLGASDYAMSWYTFDETANDYTMANFSIARDREKMIPYIKEALKVKPDLHLWASPWVVPSWMLNNGSIKTDAQTMRAHALYFARFVEEYAKEGLKIEAVHFQNEPGYGRVRGWTGPLFISYVKTYMAPVFAERNITAEIWCGTMSKDPDDTNIAKATAADAEVMKIVKGFGVQWNLQAAVPTLAAKATVMQTEHTCGNYNFDTPYWKKSQYNPNMPPNDHAYGEESWQLIRDWIVAGVNSYNAWNMVLDTVGKSLDNWPQDALLVVDRTAKKLTRTAAYYAFLHYSSSIAVGATRIGTSGSNDAVAFKNPDGSIVVQVYNKGAAAKTTTVGVGSALSQTLYQFSVPAHGWATLRLPQ